MVDYEDFNVSQIAFECDLTDACESLTSYRKTKADFRDDLERMTLEQQLAEAKEALEKEKKGND
jgi:predicted nucleic-acid-binding protein